VKTHVGIDQYELYGCEGSRGGGLKDSAFSGFTALLFLC
jgi:hypothetical protein